LLVIAAVGVSAIIGFVQMSKWLGHAANRGGGTLLSSCPRPGSRLRANRR
jgi:hypothetical protein